MKTRLLVATAISAFAINAVGQLERGVVMIDNLPVYVLGSQPSTIECMDENRRIVYTGKTYGDYGYVVDGPGNQGDVYDDVVYYDINQRQAKRISGVNCFFLDQKGNT